MGFDLHFIDVAPQQSVTMADKTKRNLNTIVDVLLQNPNNKQYQNYFLEIDNDVDFPFTSTFSTSYYRWNLINRFLLKGLISANFNKQEKNAFNQYKTTEEFITPIMISALLKLAANINETEFNTQPYANDKYFKQYYEEFINYISTYRDYCLHFSQEELKMHLLIALLYLGFDIVRGASPFAIIVAIIFVLLSLRYLKKRRRY